jgi:hypothetical protein
MSCSNPEPNHPLLIGQYDPEGSKETVCSVGWVTRTGEPGYVLSGPRAEFKLCKTTKPPHEIHHPPYQRNTAP